MQLIEKTRISPPLTVLTLAEVKSWLNVDALDTVDDDFIADQLIPACIDFFEIQFARCICLSTVKFEGELEHLHLGCKPKELFLRRDYPAANWAITPPQLEFKLDEVWEIIATTFYPTAENQKLTFPGMIAYGCCPVQFRLTYQTGSETLTGPERLWLMNVLSHFFNDRNALNDQRLVESAIFKRLSLLNTKLVYPTAQR